MCHNFTLSDKSAEHLISNENYKFVQCVLKLIIADVENLTILLCVNITTPAIDINYRPCIFACF